MNGYIMLSESVSMLAEQGKIDKKTAEKAIRIYEFLATCDIDDLCIMVDSTAFNDLIRAFLKMAVENAGIDEESRNKVLNQIPWIFDEKNAKEVLQDSMKE